MRIAVVAVLACFTSAGMLSAQSPPGTTALAEEVRAEALRSWRAYVRYAWPHDNLRPIARAARDWYDEPLGISPIDAYSTLVVMGLTDEAERIHRYVVDSSDFAVDLDVKVFEVNIRVLGGLLAMYEFTGDSAVLARATDFGERLLPAFDTPTGVPRFSVNLQSGATSGDTVCVAEGGSYLLEFALLSDASGDPRFYTAAKRATEALHARRSDIGLLGRYLDVASGEWTDRRASVGCFVDSHYEYLYKTWLLLGDPEPEAMWDDEIAAVRRHFPDTAASGAVWYPVLDMDSGELLSREVTVWDAFFPGLLLLAGDTAAAVVAQEAWHEYWTEYGALAFGYDYAADTLTDARWQLNPEIVESNYYLWRATGDSTYYHRAAQYWADVRELGRAGVAYANLADVRTGEHADEMPTFWLAETLKYFYLTFAGDDAPLSYDTHVFSTEAHPYRKRTQGASRH